MPTPEEEKEAFEARACWEIQNHLKECEKCAPKDWEKEFDNFFLIEGNETYSEPDFDKSTADDLKFFIRNHIASHSHKIKEELKKNAHIIFASGNVVKGKIMKEDMYLVSARLLESNE